MRPGDVVYSFGELFPAKLIKRLNRFLTLVDQDGKIKECHLHDPGRIPELLPGTELLIRKTSGKRTDCSITAFLNNRTWVIADSRIHSDVASAFLPPNARREVKIGNSRLDFAYDGAYAEVKGCTLVIDGKALFPDAPTKRGLKHVKELTRLRLEGHRSELLVLIMRDDALCFGPNERMDPSFSQAFWEALNAGVVVKPLKFRLKGNDVVFVAEVPLCRQPLKFDGPQIS
ncbi:DNA/RNA nuclease SfsA [Tardisphaera miroshnichenkoae]